VSRYCFVAEHPISHSETSCSARAKTLHPVAGPHQSGVRHAEHDGADGGARNADPEVCPRTVRPLSARVKGARSENFGLSAEVFKESMKWAQVSGRDVAAATGHDSPTMAYQWARGERPIPGDAVFTWMRRLPALGARILAFCAAELPEKERAELPALIEQAAELKRRITGGVR
jgi:hypothetical protein